MREILFRGKRKKNGKWVEGYYQQRYDAFENIQHLIFWAKSYTVWEYSEIDPESVCQYTGLTDKDGRKIFEGDILKSDLGKIGKIAFNESHMAFMILECVENKYYHVEECSGNHMEVIGNVFDNPELVRNNA